MKEISIIFSLFLLSLGTFAQKDSTERFVIPVRNWEMKVVGLDNFYPTYLADPLGVRFEVSSQKILYGDIEYYDPVNEDGSYTNKLVIFPGVRISLLKFRPVHNPRLGVEVDLGMNLPVFMRGGNHDVIGLDGIYYFAIGGRPTEWLSLRFSKHHICTHLGDEYPYGNVQSPIDYDVNTTLLPVRDDFILSAAARPLWFLGNPQWDILQVYADLGFFHPGVDFMGTRQNKPNREAYMNYQGGLEVEYYFPRKIFGGVFTAINVSAYQSNAFAPNISWTGGYIFPQDRGKRRIRIGLNYYNGRALSNQFQTRKEKFLAFMVSMDV